MHGEVLEDLEDLDEQIEMLRERNTEVAYPESRNDLMWVRVCRDSVIPFIQNQGRSSLLQGDGWFVIKNGMKTVLSILLHLCHITFSHGNTTTAGNNCVGLLLQFH